jgi:large subunit ribosomal protein L20
MSRAPRSVPSHARRKKVFKQVKGFYGRRKNTITSANAAADRALQHNYIGRKEKKRNFRALWIQRINAGCREHGLTYSRFISGLAKAGIEVDRKVLSDLAIHEPQAFKALVDQAAANAPALQ